MPSSFRNAFYAGCLLALILGLYLFQLWQPTRQVELHSENLIRAMEDQDWDDVAAFLAPTYADQWAHDRELVLSRLRQVLGYLRDLQIEALEPMPIAAGLEGTWRARIRLSAEENEVSALVKSYANKLDQPFELQWQRQSWKPWDWQLVRVSNPALELPASPF